MATCGNESGRLQAMKRLEPLAPVPEEPFVTPEPVAVEPVVAMEPVVSKRRNNSLHGCGDRGLGEWPFGVFFEVHFSTESRVFFSGTGKNHK